MASKCGRNVEQLGLTFSGKFLSKKARSINAFKKNEAHGKCCTGLIFNSTYDYNLFKTRNRRTQLHSHILLLGK